MGISGRAKALLPTICGSRYIPHESARDGESKRASALEEEEE